MKSKAKANIFHFKKFSIGDDRCAMKVGTDAVLLGAWVRINRAKHILDIGAGSGVISLMLAQRSGEDALVDAVEIVKADAEQANENVLNSPWPNKVTIYQKAIQAFDPPYKYDLIVSNPPYFVNSLLPPSESRVKARHTISLSFEELLEHSLRLLNRNGRLAVILPHDEGNTFRSMALAKKLHLLRETAFYSRMDKPQERWLFEFSQTPQKGISGSLTLYDSNSNKSSGYRAITDDFYL
ncbi:tRNA1(Val) (adenine(37)-N6)-methyltransferase [Cytophagales bacterium WSM2-2]|nr:tRNA1(Val) (adenine(37)-N6)-methyltransferase [Cytophagales bacterium WSM2-2]